MEPELVVEWTKSKSPKITLSPTRFVVKLPIGTDASQEARILDFARRVRNSLGSTPLSLRGNVIVRGSVLVVSMHTDSRKWVGTFSNTD